MIKIYLILFFAFYTIFPQNNKFLTNQRDTSYTIYSAAKKVHKKYPDVLLRTEKLPKGIVVKKNIIYKTIGSRNLVLDVFLPEINNKKYPGVLMIHGGGWRSGDRSMLYPMAEELTANGFVTICAEYRLSTEAAYPAAVMDLKDVINWMKVNSGKYNIDKNKIAVYGCSAGGQLAALIGVTLSDTNKIQAIVNVDGVVDFLDPESEEKDKSDGTPGSAHKWFGVSEKDNPEVWKEASPINYIDKSSPPVLFINSSVSRFHAGRDRMINKLNQFNIYSEVHTIAGTPHTFWLFSPWFEETFKFTLNFLNKTLSKKNEIN